MSDFDLRSVELFAKVPEADLELLASNLGDCRVRRGETLFSEGDPGDKAYIVTSGDMEILKESAGRQVRLAVIGAGSIVGEMALLTAEPRNATARALTDVDLVSIPKDAFDTVVNNSAAATRALFDVFLKRWREQEDRLKQSERMAQIGVLTAGLAHEMNNPSAAVHRGASELGPAIAAHRDAVTALPVDIVVPELPDRRDLPVLSGMERSDKETAIEDALDDLGVADGWRLSGSLVDAGLSPDDLMTIDREHADTIIAALASAAEVQSLLAEVDEGARRMSELVGALKSYSFLDQAPVLEVDVTKGIEDTLLILRSKIKKISIERNYDPDLPRITAYGSQLNQVWTNLIDNAADALLDAEIPDPTITIETAAADESIVVRIGDNGPGIPPDVIDRIFEAFYTTKEPGRGTGLGLDTTYSIIVKQHRGDVTVESTPGSTVFTVTIPRTQDTAVD